MPQSTKYQLKKDLKRNVGQVPNEINFPESKRTKLTSSQHVETPVKCPNFKSLRKVVEEEEIKKRYNERSKDRDNYSTLHCQTGSSKGVGKKSSERFK